MVKKKLNGYSPGKKKTQLNNPEEKKLAVGQEKKNSTAGWPGKKKLNMNSLPGGPPRSLMVRPLPSALSPCFAVDEI